MDALSQRRPMTNDEQAEAAHIIGGDIELTRAEFEALRDRIAQALRQRHGAGTDDARQLLTECSYVITGLADQQAMSDDFYKATLSRIDCYLAAAPIPEEPHCPACGGDVNDHLQVSRSGDKDWRCLTPETAAPAEKWSPCTIIYDGSCGKLTVNGKVFVPATDIDALKEELAAARGEVDRLRKLYES